MTDNPTHGGARLGAGRPKLSPAKQKVQIAIRLRRELLDGIAAITKNRTAFITKLIEKALGLGGGNGT